MREFRRDRLQNHIWLTASSYMVKYFRISSYIRKPFLIHDFATAPIWNSLYEEKFGFLFYQCSYLSVSLLITRPPSAASRVQETSRTVPASGRRTRATSVTVAPGRARPPPPPPASRHMSDQLRQPRDLLPAAVWAVRARPPALQSRWPLDSA